MKLSILIPARNEMFLAKTIKDILAHIQADTEIIAVLDGGWSPKPIKQHPRLTVIYLPESIGQRAATNLAAKISQGEYLMKVDAHCAFADGFDRVLLADITPDMTMVPLMKNLHAFDWVCGKCGYRSYQGPTPTACPKCDNTTDFERDILWQAKRSPNSTAYRFTPELEFQYWSEYKKRQKGDLVETLSLQGSCWMVHRDKYFSLNLCDEAWGSWGGQGAEVALKTWLSGGRVLVNKKTWYAHLFRTQGGDFSFPYPNPAQEQKRAKDSLRQMFLNDQWPGAIYKLSWLIDRFSPVPGWEKKGIVYYTDNRLDSDIMSLVQMRLERISEEKGIKITSVSLEPISFGENMALNLERGYLTMFKQILAGLEACEADIVFFCEHDVLYHPSHFDFYPEKENVFYYNENVWKVDATTGQALFHYVQQTSGLCAYRQLLLEHYRRRVELVEQNGFSRKMGFEPGTHNRTERVDDYKAASWMSEFPNIDIRHAHNLTPSRWSKNQFRNQRYTRGWTMADQVPGWGQTRGRFNEFLRDAVCQQTQ